MLPPRFDISRDQIELVVRRFYARVRSDAQLGPIFARHVDQWPSHEAKITCFWANAILHERNYDGNPMAAHLAAGNVKSQHFPRWLAIFDEILIQELSPPVAASWSALAHRIGRGLSFGVSEAARAPTEVPVF
jgi:hemoglobin